MSDWWNGFAIGAAASSIFVALVGLVLRMRYERVAPGWALVLRGRGGACVSMRSRLVWPGIEVYRVAMHPHGFDLSLRGEDAVWSKERAQIEVVARVTLRLAPDPDRVLEAVSWLGCERASDTKVLADLFRPQIEEALHAVASTFTGEEVYARRLDFRDRVVELVAPNLRGFVIDAVAISTFQKLS